MQSNGNLAESHCNRFFRIFTVYIIFVYTILFVSFWSFMNTASYKLAWIISPFGLTLAVFSFILYLKSKRLQIEDFKFQSMTNNNDDSIDGNIIHVNDLWPILTTSRRTGIKDN